jgi:hypothetical protein
MTPDIVVDDVDIGRAKKPVEASTGPETRSIYRQRHRGGFVEEVNAKHKRG